MLFLRESVVVVASLHSSRNPERESKSRNRTSVAWAGKAKHSVQNVPGRWSLPTNGFAVGHLCCFERLLSGQKERETGWLVFSGKRVSSLCPVGYRMQTSCVVSPSATASEHVQ